MAVVQDEIIGEMSRLPDRLAKYEYLVSLGRGLAVPDDGIRSDEFLLAGCQSRVWIRTELRDGRLRITADSDTMITRGIIALLLRVLDGRPPTEIVAADLYFLDVTGLSMHLSPARADGLTAMVRRIRASADAAPGDRAPGERVPGSGTGQRPTG
jgi:cysteine desulfuration protein SufE